jgi:hypothetical protein
VGAEGEAEEAWAAATAAGLWMLPVYGNKGSQYNLQLVAHRKIS